MNKEFIKLTPRANEEPINIKVQSVFFLLINPLRKRSRGNYSSLCVEL